MGNRRLRSFARWGKTAYAFAAGNGWFADHLEESSGAWHIWRLASLPFGAGSFAVSDFPATHRLRIAPGCGFQSGTCRNLDGRRLVVSVCRQITQTPGKRPKSSLSKHSSGPQRLRHRLCGRGNLLRSLGDQWFEINVD